MDGRSSGRRTAATVAMAVALAAGLTTNLHAQQRVFAWTGRVDHDVEITLRGNAFVTTRLGSDERVAHGSSALTALPQETGILTLRVLEGRGLVDVEQQPTSETGYTAVIRIHDAGVGSDLYRIDAYWQPAAAGEVVAPVRLVSERERVREIQNRTALIWTGDVDSELEIILRPEGITYYTVRGAEPRALQSALNQRPWPNAELEINQIEGRGEASITQQPSAENGYTAKLRVRDPQPGFGHYAFMAIWR
jgi:hypothetical protein